MSSEAAEQLKTFGVNRPTHIFVQAGVGSLASSVQGYFANLFHGTGPDDSCPTTVIMEAQAADCLYRSASTKDGHIEYATGDLSTMMAGLACGEPNTIGWDILKNHSAAFVSCPDWVSASGMRRLAAPLSGDQQVISGESGAVGMGLIAAVMTDPAYAELKTALKLDENSRVLMFSTEGATDPENWRDVVWNGKQID
jgi:diaminopropionate ammonia-lyase